MSEHDELHQIRKSSRRSALVSALGFVIVAFSIGYSALSLNKLSNEKADLREEKDALENAITQKMDSLQQLDSILLERSIELNASASQIDEMKKNLKKLSGWKEILNAAIDSAGARKFEAAVKLYSQCLDEFDLAKEEQSQIQQFRGYAYYRLEDYTNARKDLKAALEAGGTVASDALFTLVLVEANSKNQTQALEYANQIGKSDPEAFKLLPNSVPVSLRTNKEFVDLREKVDIQLKKTANPN